MNNILSLIIFFLLICFSGGLKAQDIYFSNYPQHLYFYNPAFAGKDSMHTISVTGKTQFANISNPERFFNGMIAYNQPLCNYKVGIGGLVTYNNNSLYDIYMVELLCNYKFKLATDMNIRVGASVEQQFYYLKKTNSSWIGGVPPPSEIYIFDGAVGFEYDWQNFFLGVSVKSIIPKSEPGQLNFHYPINLYSKKIITAGYKLNICKSFTTIPSLLYHYQGPSKQFQLSNDMCFKKTFLLGVGLIYDEAISISAGISLKNKFQVMLTHDFTTHTLTSASYNPNIIEAAIQYKF